MLTCGRDILHDLVTAVDPAQQQNAPRVLKRRRDDDASQDASSAFVPYSTSHANAGPRQSALPTGPSPPSAFPGPFYDFSPPMHRDDLPSRQPSVTDFNFGGLWQTFGAQPDVGAQQSFDVPMAAEGALPVDPDLEAIFADLLPTSSYEDPFAVPLYPNQSFAGAAPEPPTYPPAQIVVEDSPRWFSGPPASS